MNPVLPMKARRMHAPTRRPRRSAGMTLVELMVGITIGMLIVAAMAILFANNSRTRAETERSSQKIENGRYALDVISADLQHAGFFGEFDPRSIALPAATPDPCVTASDMATLRSAMPVYAQGFDSVGASTLACINDVKPGTDVFVVRRAANCVDGSAGCTNLATGAPAFQASSCNDVSELGSGVVANFYKLENDVAALTLHKRDCAAVADIRRYLVRIYYVANNDVGGDGIPTLKRSELRGAGSGPSAFTTVSLVQGVENLQVDWGMDTNNDGAPDTYTASPEGFGGCNATTSPTCVERWTSVVSAKVHVLSRNLERSPGHVDGKSYALGTQTVAAANDNYKRSVFQELVRLQNPSVRRLLP